MSWAFGGIHDCNIILVTSYGNGRVLMDLQTFINEARRNPILCRVSGDDLTELYNQYVNRQYANRGGVGEPTLIKYAEQATLNKIYSSKALAEYFAKTPYINGGLDE